MTTAAGPLPIGAPVTVTIQATVIDAKPMPEGGGSLYQVRGEDGRERWVPWYNLADRRPGP